MENFNNRIKKKLKEAPSKPGVYIMKDSSGTIIYIGKAKNLKKRVSQYFIKSSAFKQKLLSKQIDSIEYILSKDETDALILENILIKKHKPPYNILLKDDKTYPYLSIDLNSEFPTLKITRKNIKSNGILNFGPFPAVGRLKKARKLLINIFMLRPCIKMKKKKCLYSQIGKCSGYCEFKEKDPEYNERVNELIELLKNKSIKKIMEFDKLMKKASSKMDYENAAYYRDLMFALRLLWDMSEVESIKGENTDYIGFRTIEEICFLMILSKRNHKVDKVSFYSVEKNPWDSSEEIMIGILLQYYSIHDDLPDRMYFLEHRELFSKIKHALYRISEKKIKELIRKNEQQKKHISFIKRNFEFRIKKFLSENKKSSLILKGIKEIMELKKYPNRIECYDISNLGGTLAVASMVTFLNGKPSKKDYRKFKIKTVKGQDDFSMLREIIRRRSEHPEWGIPDLLLIDGGLGQLNSVLKEDEAIIKMGIPDILSIAKKEELIFSKNHSKPIRMPHHDERLRLLVYLRDEAHRFAIGFQRSRRKSMLRSVLEEIPGFGKKRREKLLEYYPNIAELMKATVEEISNIPGISKKMAKKIFEGIRGKG